MSRRRILEPRAVELVGHMDALVRRFMSRPGGEARDDVPLTRQEIQVVLTLGGGDVSMGELAGRMARAVSTLTGVVDRLVRQSLVRRAHDESDRRVVRVGLTAAGRRLHGQLRQRRLELAHGVLAALDEREQNLFLSLIRKMSASVFPGVGTARGATAPARAGRGV